MLQKVFTVILVGILGLVPLAFSESADDPDRGPMIEPDGLDGGPMIEPDGQDRGPMTEPDGDQ